MLGERKAQMMTAKATVSHACYGPSADVLRESDLVTEVVRQSCMCGSERGDFLLQELRDCIIRRQVPEAELQELSCQQRKHCKIGAMMSENNVDVRKHIPLAKSATEMCLTDL